MSNGNYPRAPFGQGATFGKNEPVTSHRAPVNKAKSSAEFRRNRTRTKYANIHDASHALVGASRGGIRL